MVRQAHHERIISPLSLSLSKAELTMKWTTFVALNRVIPLALSSSKGEAKVVRQADHKHSMVTAFFATKR